MGTSIHNRVTLKYSIIRRAHTRTTGPVAVPDVIARALIVFTIIVPPYFVLFFFYSTCWYRTIFIVQISRTNVFVYFHFIRTASASASTLSSTGDYNDQNGRARHICVSRLCPDRPFVSRVVSQFLLRRFTVNHSRCHHHHRLRLRPTCYHLP